MLKRYGHVFFDQAMMFYIHYRNYLLYLNIIIITYYS